MVTERVLVEASKLSEKYLAFVEDEENVSGERPVEFPEDGIERD